MLYIANIIYPVYPDVRLNTCKFWFSLHNFFLCLIIFCFEMFLTELLFERESCSSESEGRCR